MSRRTLLLLPAVLAATAVPVSPALAGEDDPPVIAPVPAPLTAPDPATMPAVRVGFATLRSTQCVSRARAKATVRGELIDSVVFYVDGEVVKTVDEPDAVGRYSLAMRCSYLRVGAHGAKAVVSFEEGATPASTTLRFQITRSRRGTPRFAG
jgi:hypothetical protein